MNRFCWLSGQFLFVTAVSAQMIYGPTDNPKDYPKALAREGAWVAQHPTYGFTYIHHERPENLIAIGESANSQNSVERLHNLVEAAKPRSRLDLTSKLVDLPKSHCKLWKNIDSSYGLLLVVRSSCEFDPGAACAVKR
jgi:hypothetical protein